MASDSVRMVWHRVHTTFEWSQMQVQRRPKRLSQVRRTHRICGRVTLAIAASLAAIARQTRGVAAQMMSRLLR